MEANVSNVNEGVYLGTHPVYIPTNVGYVVDNLYLQMISCSAGIPREATGRLFILHMR